MTDSAQTNARPALRSEYVVTIGIIAVALVAAFYLFSQSKQVLRSSPAGFDGLHIWLNAEDVSAQSFAGGWSIDKSSVGLMILPIFDTDLDAEREAPKTKEELLLQQDEYDLFFYSIADRARDVPALVVLPKWRTGMRLTGLGHPVLLVRPDGATELLQDLTGDTRAHLDFGQTPFTDFAYQGDKNARIYAAQMFNAKGCTPIIGRNGRMLLGECPLAGGDPEDTVLVLSDPDLLNNHGLRLGQNAEIARDFLAERATDKNVLIDYSPRSWLRHAQNEITRDRTWRDMLRFFDPPFLALWLGAAFAMALTLWRAALRFGPLPRDASHIKASKSYAVQARARLMRLSDCDGALVAEYAKARLGTVAATLFGPRYAQRYAQKDAFIEYVKRRDALLAGKLHSALAAIDGLPDRIPATQAITHVDELELILERVTHDT